MAFAAFAAAMSSSPASLPASMPPFAFPASPSQPTPFVTPHVRRFPQPEQSRAVEDNSSADPLASARSYLVSDACALLPVQLAAQVATGAHDLTLRAMLQTCAAATQSSRASGQAQQSTTSWLSCSDCSSNLPSAEQLLLALLQYLQSLRLRFHSLECLSQRLISTCESVSPPVQESANLLIGLVEPAHCSSCSADGMLTAAWTLLLHSGAGPDLPFFLRLLRLQQTPSSGLSASFRQQSLGLTASVLPLSAVQALLQTFVRHYVEETRDPLVWQLSHALNGQESRNSGALSTFLTRSHRRVRSESEQEAEGAHRRFIPRPRLDASISPALTAPHNQLTSMAPAKGDSASRSECSHACALQSSSAAMSDEPAEEHEEELVTSARLHQLFLQAGAEQLDAIAAGCSRLIAKASAAMQPPRQLLRVSRVRPSLQASSLHATGTHSLPSSPVKTQLRVVNNTSTAEPVAAQIPRFTQWSELEAALVEEMRLQAQASSASTKL